MLVEVNLLPKKEKTNYTPYFLSGLIVACYIIGGLVFYFQYQISTAKVSSLQNQLTSAKKLTEIQMNNLQIAQSPNAIEELKKAIKWSEAFPTPTVFMLKQLSNLLPERGLLRSFSFTDTGSVSIQVQFDTSREAAYYLKALKDSPYFTKVMLTNIATQKDFIKSVNPNANQENPNNNETPNNEENQDANITKNEADIDEENEKYMGRYIGNYEITIIKDALKKDAEKEDE